MKTIIRIAACIWFVLHALGCTDRKPAAEDTAPQSARVLEIWMGPSRSMSAYGSSLSPEMTAAIIQIRRRDHGPFPVAITVARGASHDDLKWLMDICASNGCTEFSSRMTDETLEDLLYNWTNGTYHLPVSSWSSERETK